MLLFANWRIKVRPYMKNVFYLVILKQFDRLRPVFILWIKSLRFDLEFYISQEEDFFTLTKKFWIIQAERCDHLIISYFLFQQSNSITTFVLLTAIASHLDGFGQNPSDKLPVIPLFGLFKDPKHSVWKSLKKSHSTLRAKRATFTFWGTKVS